MLNNWSSYGTSFDIMSSSNSHLPADVKKWSPKVMINYLKSKKDELYLSEEDILIIEQLDFSGEDYLESTETELRENYKLTPGAAKRILRILNKLNEQANRDAGDETNSFREEVSSRQAENKRLDVNKTFEDQKVDDALIPTTTKNIQKRTKLDNINTLREEFRKLYDAKKASSEKFTFQKVADEVTSGRISAFTISNFYNGGTDLTVGQNRIAIEDWVKKTKEKMNYRKKMTKKYKRNWDARYK